MSDGLRIEPLDAPLGARVSGIDLAAAPTSAVIEAIRTAWREHLVLVFPGQQLDDEALMRFAKSFGELDPPGPNPYGKEPLHPTHPELNVISNIVENGRPIGNLGDGEAVWHADMTYVERPPKGAILYALELPSSGGDTHFASMYAAYEGLSPDLRAAIDGRKAVHDASHNSAGIRRTGYDEVTDVRLTPGARHPLARLDAATGRRCLFLGRRPRSYVIDTEVEESERILDSLWAHATSPEFTMVHRWSLGDVVMWDNLSVLHRRDAFDPYARRKLHRAQLRGTEEIVGAAS